MGRSVWHRCESAVPAGTLPHRVGGRRCRYRVARYGFPSRHTTASPPIKTNGLGVCAATTGIACTRRSIALPTRSTTGADAGLPDTYPGLGWFPLIEDLLTPSGVLGKV